MMIFLRPLLPLITLASVSFAEITPLWLTSYAEAFEIADKSKKLILADFNGSDWCAPCISLKKDILDTAQFRKFAADKLVFLDVDLPRKTQMAKSQLEANKKLLEIFQVKAYPTVLIINTRGLVVGGFVGGRSQRAFVEDEVLASLQRAKRMGEVLQLSDAAEGMDKAKLMLEAYEMLPMEMRGFNHMLKHHIKSLDADDALGLRNAQKDAVAQKEELKAIMDNLRGYSPYDAQGMLAINKYLEGKLAPANHALLLMLRARAQVSLAESLEDIAKAKEFYIIAANADSSKTKEHLAFIEKLFSDPQAFLDRVKKSRTESLKAKSSQSKAIKVKSSVDSQGS